MPYLKLSFWIGCNPTSALPLLGNVPAPRRLVNDEAANRQTVPTSSRSTNTPPVNTQYLTQSLPHPPTPIPFPQKKMATNPPIRRILPLHPQPPLLHPHPHHLHPHHHRRPKRIRPRPPSHPRSRQIAKSDCAAIGEMARGGGRRGACFA